METNTSPVRTKNINSQKKTKGRKLQTLDLAMISWI